jgi:predicted enzyme related to lactoylglutathione lyase
MEHSFIPWIQIPVKNLVRAATFYEAVFGASFFFEELNNIPHAVFKKNVNGKKILNGALIEIQKKEGVTMGPVLFFDATGDFETILFLIKKNGGSVIKNKTLITKKETNNQNTIPNTYIDNKPGYYAHFIDSEGNRMGLYGTN